MPKIPLEDNFTDVIGKAQRGHGLSDTDLAARANLSPADLTALKSGRINEHHLRAVARVLRLSGDALLAMARKEWYPHQPNFPRGFAMFNTPFEDMTVNSYLVWDTRTRHAAAFDTGADCGAMLDTISAESLDLRYIFITHTHDDHIADLTRLATTTGAPVWAHELEPAPHPGAQTFKENVHFHIGELAIKTLLTSGHSVGQTTYYITGHSYPIAIVGDSLFASSIGGGLVSFEDQYRNNVRKILNRPSDTVLAAGHGPLSTVRQERIHNPFFVR